MAESYSKGEKTLLEREKSPVTSNFSFSHSVFKRLVHHKYCRIVKTRACFGKGLLFTIRQNFRLLQIKSICRRQNTFDSKNGIWFEKNRKHDYDGERRKCWLQAIFAFLTMFSKGLSHRANLKLGLCGKGLSNNQQFKFCRISLILFPHNDTF